MKFTWRHDIPSKIGQPQHTTSPDRSICPNPLAKQAKQMTWVESTAQLQGHAWQGDPETQLRSSLSSCVSHPSGLPPLQQMLVAGDLIGIAIVDLNPSVAAILDELLHWLATQAVQSEHVAVVLPMGTIPPATLCQFERVQAAHEGVHWVKHDPQDPQGSSYLAANAAASPIYINRVLVDADVVIAIRSPLSPHPEAQAIAMACELYPQFTNFETWSRLFQTYAQVPDKKGWQAEVVESEEWLGIIFWIECLHHPNGQIQTLLSGDRKSLSVAREASYSNYSTPSTSPVSQMIVLDVPKKLDWNWPHWLAAIDRLRCEQPEPPKILLHGELPPWPITHHDNESPETADEALAEWIKMVCERVGTEGDLWVLGPKVEKLAEIPGWFWLDSESEADKLLDRFDDRQLVCGTSLLAGQLG